MTKEFNHDNLDTIMIKFVKISKLFLVLALLPASASAVTITISAPSDSATELTVTATGTYSFHHIGLPGFPTTVSFGNIGNYLADDGPNGKNVNLAVGILANGETATSMLLDSDPGQASDDFRISFDGAEINGTYALSGSSTLDLSGIGHNFGQLNIGTYEANGNSLIVEYSSVPDTGSTAALLGVGAAALAFARRRLG